MYYISEVAGNSQPCQKLTLRWL